MPLPVPDRLSGAARPGARASALLLLAAAALGGCSFDLGSFSPTPEKQEPPPSAAAGISVAEAQAATARGQTLARSGKTDEALAEFRTMRRPCTAAA